MLARQSLQRASRLVRTPVVRRPYSSHGVGETGLHGPADNAFNRERQAVKNHAAATSDTWRKLSIYVVIPLLCMASANAWTLWNEHWEHVAHGPPLEERPEYPYMNIRSKNYPWGDGDKTIFWNDKVNYHKKDE
ncbi:putative cytochrome c oxidase subunit VIa [Cryomyces antarcticus]